MSDASNKPSQAEGEDPDRPGTGDGSEATDMPSQAEGEDRSPQTGDQQSDGTADGGTPGA
ncbi:hypothetical protein [Microbacterium sp. BK668]|uniref:hypothetical protein n=1 Tax=Microbacterium sp. BK668 TaxID=2512118 RepID=UPI00105DBA10|nr:hypothetical protein [Microbacterium sp. BK668]TDN90684.1 hypothetical protein EV279_0172 [Microbacterium sp. BK668]